MLRNDTDKIAAGIAAIRDNWRDFECMEGRGAAYRGMTRRDMLQIALAFGNEPVPKDLENASALLGKHFVFKGRGRVVSRWTGDVRPDAPLSRFTLFQKWLMEGLPPAPAAPKPYCRPQQYGLQV